MRALLLHLMLNEGLSYGIARSIINLYGKLTGNPEYSVGDNQLQQWQETLQTDYITEHADFDSALNDMKNIVANQNNVRIG